SLFQTGRHERALVEIDAALHENPELAPALVLKGLLLARRANFTEAAGCLEYAVRIDADQVGAWLALAYVRLELGLYDRALEAADRAIRMDNTQAYGYWLRGNALAIQKRNAEAIAAYRLTLRYNPQFTTARLKLASLLAETGATDEAVRQSIVALRFNPTDQNARMAVGDLLRLQGKREEALREYMVAADLRPLQALPHVKRGETYLELGLVVDAIMAFRLALRLDPKQVNAYLHLGRIYMGQKNYGEAAELFQAALAIDPRYPEAITLLDATKQRLTAGGPPGSPEGTV